jgi:hypothetical protein
MFGRIDSALRAGCADAALKVAVITSDHARESGPWLGSRCIWAGCDTTLLVAGAWDCPNQRAHAIDSLQGLTNYQFSLSPPADVPVFLSTSEIGLSPRLSSIRKILSPAGRLGMLVDVDRGKQFYVRFEDRLFRMATGPIRLAQMLDAALVPVLIVETSTWKYTIHFGSPVPQRYLGSPPDMEAIGTHLLQEFSKVITRHPEQGNMRLLRAMCPLPENGVADLSAVIQAAENP